MHNFSTDPVIQKLRNRVRHNLKQSERKPVITTPALIVLTCVCLLAFCSAQTENDLLTQELTSCQTGEKPPFVKGGLGGFSQPKQEPTP